MNLKHTLDLMMNCNLAQSHEAKGVLEVHDTPNG